MCRAPIDLLTMEVDHVIPERLLDEPATLATILSGYGLASKFDLQSFANWLPSCKPCNNRKLGRIFEPTPRIQMDLQIAREKAGAAAKLTRKRVGNRQSSRAWNLNKQADAAGDVSEKTRNAILEFASFHVLSRSPEMRSEPLQFTPLIHVLSEKDGTRFVKGRYGVGGGPTAEVVDNSFRCGSCGSMAWNGPRCVVCGELSDD